MFKYNHGYANTQANLNSDMGLAQLLGVVNGMDNSMGYVKNKDVVLVIGATGAGKSTFVNYLAGCDMQVDDSGYQESIFSNNQKVQIGQGDVSCTSIPQLCEVKNSAMLMCDCPGFFDNRGVELEIANAIGIRSVAKNSQLVKGIVLIVEAHTFLSERGKGLTETLISTFEFLGCEIKQHFDSIMLLVSKVDKSRLDKAYKSFVEDSKQYEFCAEILKRGNFGFYSPLNDFDSAQKGVMTQANIIEKMHELKGIPNDKHTFRIAISDSAKLEVTGLIAMVSGKIRTALAKKDIKELAPLFKTVETLSGLNVKNVTEEINKLEVMVNDQIKLFEHQDDGDQTLEKLSKIMPENYKTVIQEALQRVHKRLAKEKEMIAEKQKTQAELSQSKQAIKELKGEQQKLEHALQDAKISKEEFAKQNKHLQQQIFSAQQDQKQYEGKMQKMERDLTQANQLAADERKRMMVKLEEAERKADQRVEKLQAELEKSRNEKIGSENAFDGIPVIWVRGVYPCYGGGYPGMYQGGF